MPELGNALSVKANEPVSRCGPAASRRRLGNLLRQLRQDGGLYLDDVAHKLGIAPSTLSRIETGKAAARPSYVQSLLDLYTVADPEQRSQIQGLARDGWHVDWYAPYRHLLPAGAGHYLTLESEASMIRIVATQIVPALLSSPDYAAAVCRAAHPGLSPDDAQALACLTVRRQEFLRRPGVAVHVILDEAVLHRPVGSRRVLVGQLAHLAGHVTRDRTIQVLPFAAPWPVLNTPYSLLTFSDPADDTACTVTATGQHVITQREADTSSLREAFRALSSAALPPDETASLIGHLAKQHQ